MWQMYPEVHIYIFALTKTFSLERLLFRISIWEVEDMLVSSAKGTRRIFSLSTQVLFLRWLVAQVPCLASLLPSDSACSVVWWHPQSHLLYASLGSLSIPLQHSRGAASPDSGCCPLSSKEVILIISPVLCPPFHVAFLGEFLQESNTSHAGYRIQIVGGWGVLAREKSSWKTGLRSELKVLQGKMGPNPRLPHSVQEPEPPATKE